MNLARVVKIAVPATAVAIAIMVSASVFLHYSRMPNWFGHDFAVYWRTARLPVNQAYFFDGLLVFPYPPTMFAFIEPLKLFARPPYPAFALLSVLAFAVAVRDWRLLGLSMISPSFVRGIFAGQISVILAAAVIWAFRTPNRLLAGTALGVTAAIKPQLVLFVRLMLVLNRDRTALFSAAVAGLGAVAISALYGLERWSEWIASLPHFRDILSESGLINIAISPAGIAEANGLPVGPALAIGAIMGAWLVFSFRNEDPFGKAAAVGAASLLASPYALPYDFVIVLPYLAAATMKVRPWAACALALSSPYILLIGSRSERVGRDRRFLASRR